LPIWGARSNYGQAHGQFSTNFIQTTNASNYAINDWTALSVYDDNTINGGAAFWTRSLLGYSQGAYWLDSTPVSSPSQANGVAIFDSDYLDNAGIVGGFGLGTSPGYSGHRGELISPRIDLTGYTDSVLVVEFFAHRRDWQNDSMLVGISVDDGATWTDVDYRGIIPDTTETYGLVPFPNVTDGASNLTQCRLRFVFDGSYYFSIVDDVTIINGSLFSQSSCPFPDVTIAAPFLRPGFSNQSVSVQVCNKAYSNDTLFNSYVDVTLDSLLFIQSANVVYDSLGNNLYRVNTGDLKPGDCENIVFSCSLSTAAVLGQTLCLQAQLYPLDSCSLDDILVPDPSTSGICVTTPWDNSNLSVEGACENDSACFVIKNIGKGDMTCFSQVRIYKNAQLVALDSVQLDSAEQTQFCFAAAGLTWRLEVDQHPLHPGNSQPNATVELCGDSSTTTFDLGFWNLLPQNDADSYIDIFCGVVRGSYDPNDKTGIPNGVGPDHDILPGHALQYLIRFQNTGTDTAFNIVITDTLCAELNLATVVSGASSDSYTFQIKPGRVLEWTFANIMLPDSNVNEPLSHGHVLFSVNQTPNLPLGTRIENSAAIYFDFNAPIITNTYFHTLNVYNASPITAVRSILIPELAINLYPNPNQGWFYLEQKTGKKLEIIVTDNLGRVVLTKQSADLLTEITISELQTGIYYVQINDGTTAVTRKVIKQ
jgi:uncharacterized repeat protein (TIGR01451 family)